MSEPVEQRKSGIRRDINDLFRGPDGKISGSKIGTYAGQFIAAKLLLNNSDELIKHWDSLAIMFTVLIAPLLWGRFVEMKFGAVMGGRAERVEHRESASVTTTTTGPAKVDNPDVK
jgi:hypothetical protein